MVEAGVHSGIHHPDFPVEQTRCEKNMILASAALETE